MKPLDQRLREKTGASLADCRALIEVLEMPDGSLSVSDAEEVLFDWSASPKSPFQLWCGFLAQVKTIDMLTELVARQGEQIDALREKIERSDRGS